MQVSQRQELLALRPIQELLKKAKRRGSANFTEIEQSIPEDWGKEKVEEVYLLLEDFEIPVEQNVQRKIRARNREKFLEKTANRLYIQQIQKLPLLDQEEEFSLSKEICSDRAKIHHILFSFQYTLYEFESLIQRKPSNLLHPIYEPFSKALSSLRQKNAKLDLKDPFALEELKQQSKKIEKFLLHKKEEFQDSQNSSFPDSHGWEIEPKSFTNLIKRVEKLLQKFVAYHIQTLFLEDELGRLAGRRAPKERLKREMDEIKILLGAPTETLLARHKSLKEIRQSMQKSKEKLISANLRLVMNIARKYIHSGISFLDLVQEGNIGLIRASERFDHKKGCRFSTYASWWIKQSIIRSIATQSRLIRVPLQVNEDIKKINIITREMSQSLSREPTLEEMSKRLDYPIVKIKEILSLSTEPLSLESSICEENKNLLDFLVDETNTSSKHETLFLLREELKDILSKLPSREGEILQFRFGLKDGHPYTLKETGVLFNITRERVRQIELQALKRLRNSQKTQELRDYLCQF